LTTDTQSGPGGPDRTGVGGPRLSCSRGPQRERLSPCSSPCATGRPVAVVASALDPTGRWYPKPASTHCRLFRWAAQARCSWATRHHSGRTVPNRRPEWSIPGGLRAPSRFAAFPGQTARRLWAWYCGGSTKPRWIMTARAGAIPARG